MLDMGMPITWIKPFCWASIITTVELAILSRITKYNPGITKQAVAARIQSEGERKAKLVGD